MPGKVKSDEEKKDEVEEGTFFFDNMREEMKCRERKI